jgi:hypothetical protein
MMKKNMLSGSINTTSWMQQQRKKEAIDVKKQAQIN